MSRRFARTFSAGLCGDNRSRRTDEIVGALIIPSSGNDARLTLRGGLPVVTLSEVARKILLVSDRKVPVTCVSAIE